LLFSVLRMLVLFGGAPVFVLVGGGEEECGEDADGGGDPVGPGHWVDSLAGALISGGILVRLATRFLKPVMSCGV
jgi:hypothetical protein